MFENNDTIRYIRCSHIPKGTIMRKPKYSVVPLLDAFKKHLVLSHDSIASILGTSSKMTIFRKLQTLDYCTSYSHTGRYYLLKRFVNFDVNGLWSHGDVHFSKAGSLMETIPVLVENSLEGYFAVELRKLLQIKVQDALIKLYYENKLKREQLKGEYLYISFFLCHDQLRNREESLRRREGISNLPDGITDAISDHMRFLLSILNEKQSRLYLGFESIRIGDSGDAAIARMTGVNIKTIARGRHELEQKNVDTQRIRKIGAGRPPFKKN